MALSADIQRYWSEDQYQISPPAAADTYYRGAMVMIGATTGTLQVPTSTIGTAGTVASHVFAGIVKEQKVAAANDRVEVRRPRRLFDMPIGSPTQAIVGDVVYAIDDDELTTALPASANDTAQTCKVGTIIAVDTVANTVDIECDYQGPPVTVT